MDSLCRLRHTCPRRARPDTPTATDAAVDSDLRARHTPDNATPNATAERADGAADGAHRTNGSEAGTHLTNGGEPSSSEPENGPIPGPADLVDQVKEAGADAAEQGRMTLREAVAALYDEAEALKEAAQGGAAAALGGVATSAADKIAGDDGGVHMEASADTKSPHDEGAAPEVTGLAGPANPQGTAVRVPRGKFVEFQNGTLWGLVRRPSPALLSPGPARRGAAHCTSCQRRVARAYLRTALARGRALPLWRIHHRSPTAQSAACLCKCPCAPSESELAACQCSL